MVFDAMFVENSGYIFRIWNELYWAEYRALRDSAENRASSRLFFTDTEHLSTASKIRTKPFKCRFVDNEPSLYDIKRNIVVYSVKIRA